MSTSATIHAPDAKLFSYFTDPANLSGNDWRYAKRLAGEQAAAMIAEAATRGASVNELLQVLYVAQSVIGDSGRKWVRYMIEFVQAWKPDFELAQNRFQAGTEDTVVDYDVSMRNCVEYLENLVLNAASSVVSGLDVKSVFDHKKLEKLNDAYHKDPKAQEALERLKNGQKLNNSQREKLKTLFSLASEVLSSLNQSFGGMADVGSRGDVVSIDDKALSAQATQLTTRQQRLLDSLVDQIRYAFNPGSMMR